MHTFWHSSTRQSHRSSPHLEKYLRAYDTTFRIDDWVLCFQDKSRQYTFRQAIRRLTDASKRLRRLKNCIRTSNGSIMMYRGAKQTNFGDNLVLEERYYATSSARWTPVVVKVIFDDADAVRWTRVTTPAARKTLTFGSVRHICTSQYVFGASSSYHM